MIAIKGIYDGTTTKPLEPIPIDNKKETRVVITFLEEKDTKENWRKLRGSAKGFALTEALLHARQEESKRDK